MSNSTHYAHSVFMIGNPLLDIQANVDKAYLDKYGLKENDAILAEEKHFPIYEEIQKLGSVKYLAGGSAQNTARGVALLLGPDSVTYTGAVGKDASASKLEESNKEHGVNTAYQVLDAEKTGTCAVLITGYHRSMVTNLAAANLYNPEHLKKPAVWQWVEKATFIVISGYFLTVSGEAAEILAKHAHEHNKPLLLSVSAPFIPLVFKDTLAKLTKYVDVLFGNETELEAFAKAFGLDGEHHMELAKEAQAMPKANTSRPRMVVITQSEKPVIVADDKGVKTYPVPEIDPKIIVDSNGAGDAFLAGLVSAMVAGNATEKCVELGCKMGQQVLFESGGVYNEKCRSFGQTLRQ